MFDKPFPVLGQPAKFVQLYPNEAGEQVTFEDLSQSEKRRLIEEFGQAELFDKVVFEFVEGRTLFGRMLIERLGEIAAADPIILADLQRATPKRQRGTPRQWDDARYRFLLTHYYFLLAINGGPRGDVLDVLARSEGLAETQSVEDKISKALSKVDPSTIQRIREACEHLERLPQTTDLKAWLSRP